MKRISLALLLLIVSVVFANADNLLLGIGSSAGSNGSAPAPYTGQVATRTYLPDDVNLTNKQLRARTIHTAVDAITSMTLVFPNFYVDGFGAGATYQELGPGASSTLTAAIEYPLGTAGTAVTCPSGGVIANISTITCTWTGNIPAGSLFAVRVFYTNTGGVVFSLGGVGVGLGNVPGNFQLGDVLDAAPSGLTDNTTNGGAYTATSGTSSYGPMIIAGTTLLPSVLTIGDSKAYGEDDTGDSSGDVGEVARWISPFFANANWGIRGRDAGQFVANCTIQCSFANYFTHLINEDGINGFIHGQSAATVATNETALGNKFPTLTKYITTILPSATTTDNYATLANQTLPTYSAGVATENTRRRTSPAPFVGFFDSAAAVESSQNSGLVAVQSGGTGALGYYNSAISSVHPISGGYSAIALSGNLTQAASVINRGSSLSFSNRVFIEQTDSAVDATSQSTYTFGSKNFLIGPANSNRRIFVGCSSRFGTTGATANSLTIGGVSATKADEVIDVSGGAESITTVWTALVPSGNTAAISAVYSTTMLRAGCDVYSAVGTSAAPIVGQVAHNSIAGNAPATSAITIPAHGGTLVFASGVNGTAPTATYTNMVAITPVTLIGGTMYFTSGATQAAGSKAFTVTWSASNPSTIVAVSISP